MTNQDWDRLILFFEKHATSAMEAMQEGFRKYQHDTLYNPDAKKDHQRSTSCACVRDHIVAEIKRRFPENGEFRWYERGQLFHLNLSGNLNLQFKKLNSLKQVSQAITNQVREFRNQEALGGFLPGFKCYLGYIPNPTFTDVEDYYITCPNDFKIAYGVSLTELMPKATLIPFIKSETAQGNLLPDLLPDVIRRRGGGKAESSEQRQLAKKVLGDESTNKPGAANVRAADGTSGEQAKS